MHCDLVLMRDHSYFFLESEGAAAIDVVRIGKCSDTVQVRYEVCKPNAGGTPAARKKGNAALGQAEDKEDFSSVTGALTFEPGSTLESFEVPLRNDDSWELIESFQACLRLRTRSACACPCRHPVSIQCTVRWLGASRRTHLGRRSFRVAVPCTAWRINNQHGLHCG